LGCDKRNKTCEEFPLMRDFSLVAPM
jgi:hypothetical protein